MHLLKFESGFLDLLIMHNLYMHSPNLGHAYSIGVNGENTIIKTIPISSSFGYAPTSGERFLTGAARSTAAVDRRLSDAVPCAEGRKSNQ